jgi:prophage regulatory protein
MFTSDILDRLTVDPGRRTLGELLQDREAALFEIRRLRADIERLRAMRIPRASKTDSAEAEPAMQPGMLIRLTELCELLGVSRSTVYKWMAEGTFPPPVRVSERAVRWRTEDIQAWRGSLVASPR